MIWTRSAQGAYEQAIEYAHQARNLAEQHDNPKNLAKSYWFEGQALRSLRKFSNAIKQLTIAIEIVDHIRHGSLRWKIRLSLAETLVSAGQSPATVLQEARSLMDELRDYRFYRQDDLIHLNDMGISIIMAMTYFKWLGITPDGLF